MSSSIEPPPRCSIIEVGTSVLSCRRGDVVPPMGPVLGSRRDLSASSSSGYINRVRYEADGGAPLLGLSEPLVRLTEVLMDFVMPPELRFLFPDLEDGL